MPRIKTYSCLNCGKTVTKANTAGKYCSNVCQQNYQRVEKIKSNTASSVVLKTHLIETIGYFCSECGISEWNGKSISLELEHKNGNGEDNRIENVCLLCPNCHSQTPTYKGRNKGNGRKFRRYSSVGRATHL